jgi:hypothetical protein
VIAERIPFDVTPEQLNKERAKYNRRQLHVEDEVGDVRARMTRGARRSRDTGGVA